MSAENGTRRHELTRSQAQALAEIAQRKLAAEKEWALALTLAGLDPSRVVHGDLTEADPHFMVKVDDE
jgi:hypothetical protein